MPAVFLDDVIFPLHVSQGTAGGPDWPAEIVELVNQFEERNTPISAPIRTYDAKYGVRRPDELYEVLKLYYVARGRLYGFRMRDWSDYRSGLPSVSPAFDDQLLGTGDGVTTVFYLSKAYEAASHSFSRRITRPVAGTVLIGIDDTPTLSG